MRGCYQYCSIGGADSTLEGWVGLGRAGQGRAGQGRGKGRSELGRRCVVFAANGNIVVFLPFYLCFLSLVLGSVDHGYAAGVKITRQCCKGWPVQAVLNHTLLSERRIATAIDSTYHRTCLPTPYLASAIRS